jgi:hypothetical protein
MYGIFRRGIFFTLLGLSSAAMAQDATKEENEKGFDWNLDIVGATFLGNNSYFGESESFIGANTDDWTEGAVELGITGYFPLGNGTFFAELSGLVSATWGDDPSGLTVWVDDTHDVDFEQAHIGWRSGDTFSSLDTDALTLKAGNFDYLVGSGLLLADGTRDGGERGGWFLSVRKAFRESFLATLKSGAWKVDGFYLQGEGRRDERVYGYGGDLEYEFSGAGLNTGLLYFKVPDQKVIDGTFREKCDSLSLRGDWAATDNLSFGGEYAYQSRPGTHPKGWFLKGAYKLNDTTWTPEFSYRYAHFDGDDLSTPGDEGFVPAAYGFTDYGTWFQGEISGNYPLENSNLKSHMLRLQLSPNDDLALNVVYYDFKLDQPQIFGDPVGSTDWGDEINLAADYPIGDRWFLNGVIAWLNPGEAAINWTGGNKTWVYGMLYVSFSY